MTYLRKKWNYSLSECWAFHTDTIFLLILLRYRAIKWACSHQSQSAVNHCLRSHGLKQTTVHRSHIARRCFSPCSHWAKCLPHTKHVEHCRILSLTCCSKKTVSKANLAIFPVKMLLLRQSSSDLSNHEIPLYVIWQTSFLPHKCGYMCH